MKYVNRSIIFFTISLFSLVNVYAQPTLQAEKHKPVAGSSALFNITNANNFDVGNDGMNTSWDFSNLTGIDTIRRTFDSVFNSPDYPLANMVAIDAPSNREAYYLLDPTVLNYVGGFAVGINNTPGNQGTSVYSDLERVMVYPFAYGQTLTDDFSGDFTTNTGQTLTRSGSVSRNADAYGTLMLPNDTIQDVLRIKTVSNYQDETVVLIASYYEEVYQWFDTTRAIPLLTYKYRQATTTGFPQTPTEDAYYLVEYELPAMDTMPSDTTPTDTTTGFLVPTILDNTEVTIAPNPVKDVLFINWYTDQAAAVEVRILDLSGKELRKMPLGKYFSGKHQTSLYLNNLKTGIYIINVQIGQSVYSRQIQKQE